MFWFCYFTNYWLDGATKIENHIFVAQLKYIFYILAYKFYDTNVQFLSLLKILTPVPDFEALILIWSRNV